MPNDESEPTILSQNEDMVDNKFDHWELITNYKYLTRKVLNITSKHAVRVFTFWTNWTYCFNEALNIITKFVLLIFKFC